LKKWVLEDGVIMVNKNKCKLHKSVIGGSLGHSMTEGDSSQARCKCRQILHLWWLTFRVELRFIASGAKLRCTLCTSYLC
jgi:hypothetical protein